MVWDGALFIDTALPFGLRSAPKIFNAMADAVEWMVRQAGISLVFHYLDDFFAYWSTKLPRVCSISHHNIVAHV